MKKTLIVMAVLAVAAVAAQASVSASFNDNPFVLVGTKTIGGASYNVYDLMVNCTTDWTNAVMDLRVAAGGVYQNGFGNNQEPSPMFFGMAPDLEWDTYAAVPAGYPTLASFAGSPVIDDDQFTASWFNSTTNDIGAVLRLARVALKADAANDGTISLKVYDVSTAGVGVVFSGLSVVDGQIVPEPATMSLLAVGGVLALIRRRK